MIDQIPLDTGRSFALRLGLGDLDADSEQVLIEIGDRLAEYRPQLTSRSDGGLVLSLTIVAADLWLALLLAMAGVTGSGYPPAWIEAEPNEQVSGSRALRTARRR